MFILLDKLWLKLGQLINQEYFPNKLQEDAGSHLYKVGTDTPRFFATSLAGIPLAKNFLADFK
jgi:hypothetical protein